MSKHPLPLIRNSQKNPNAKKSYFAIIDRIAPDKEIILKKQDNFPGKLMLTKDSAKKTIIVKTDEKKYARLHILELEGDSPERTIKFKYSYPAEEKGYSN